MSEVLAPPKAAIGRASSTDRKVIAQVDKWLETIREIAREPAKN